MDQKVRVQEEFSLNRNYLSQFLQYFRSQTHPSEIRKYNLFLKNKYILEFMQNYAK